MKKKDQQLPEIESFNEELVAFDVDNLSVEALERRFELAVASLVIDLDAACGELDCASVVCSQLTCGVFTVPDQSG